MILTFWQSFQLCMQLINTLSQTFSHLVSSLSVVPINKQCRNVSYERGYLYNCLDKTQQSKFIWTDFALRKIKLFTDMIQVILFIILFDFHNKYKSIFITNNLDSLKKTILYLFTTFKFLDRCQCGTDSQFLMYD